MDTTDRYRTFKGIDVDGQTARMIARIELHTQGLDDPFWAYFFKRRNATQGMRCDDQLLLSSFVNQIRESMLFAREIGAKDMYLWGGEWWYWRQQRGDPSIWNTVREEINKAEQ